MVQVMRRFAAVLAAVLAVALTVLAGTALPASAATVRPKDDPFYTYTGSAPLASLKPGTVLKTRQVTLGAGTGSTPLPATQLLYRTADEQGRPSATVTTVVVPPGATAVPRLVAYLSFYDSLSDKCDPSYTLQGGDPGAANSQLTEVEQALVAQYYASGYITTVPDFEGPGLHWTAGHEAAYGTLDALRHRAVLACSQLLPIQLHLAVHQVRRLGQQTRYFTIFHAACLLLPGTGTAQREPRHPQPTGVRSSTWRARS